MISNMIDFRFDVHRDGIKIGEAKSSLDEPAEIIMDDSAEIKIGLTCTLLHDEQFDFSIDTICPYISINGTWRQLGEFIPTTIETAQDYGFLVDHIEAMDRTVILQQSSIEDRISLSYNAKYIDVVRSLLAECGITYVIADEDESYLPFSREEWEIGTPYLDIINQLLGEINFHSIWFDASGVARLTRDKPISYRDITVNYNRSSGIKKVYTKTIDMLNAPNVFICGVSNSDYQTPIYAKAENNFPYSKLSTYHRGRRIPIVELLSYTPNAESLQEYADRKMYNSMALNERLEFSTDLTKSHWMHEVIAIDTDDISGIYKETGWSMTLSTDVAGEGSGPFVHTCQKAVWL